MKNKFISIILRFVEGFRAFYWKFKYKIYREKYLISNSFRFNGEHILFYGNGEIITGENSYIGWFSTIGVNTNYKVVIGKNTRISHNVRMYTGTKVADQDFSFSDLKKKFGDIIIGDNVWIGVNVYINPGIKIGNNSIIGANSVVVTDVEAYSILGGVPAKLLKYKTCKPDNFKKGDSKHV